MILMLFSLFNAFVSAGKSDCGASVHDNVHFKAVTNIIWVHLITPTTGTTSLLLQTQQKLMLMSLVFPLRRFDPPYQTLPDF